MNLSLGIVGLPNVGKSTLFNALTKQQVPAENYPFNTIDPNVGVVAVQDPRFYKLVELAQPAKVTPAVVEFVDIAGLVKGAASGQGLGNKFLSNIKEVSAIVHVVRAFENSNITHVENSINPLRDIELINTELILKDIETLQNRMTAVKGRARFNEDIAEQQAFLERLMTHLEASKLAKDFEPDTKDLNGAKKELAIARREMFLLTDKPVIYLINSQSGEESQQVQEIVKAISPNPYIVMDIKIESELSEMDEVDRSEFMKELGISETSIERLTRIAYETLGLISFFTEGPEEVRAWTIVKGSKAPQAAGVIHTDFEKKFITAEVCTYEDFISSGSWNTAKAQGKMRLEGKEYTMRDGDIVVFRHG